MDYTYRRIFGRGLGGLCQFPEWLDLVIYVEDIYIDDVPNYQYEPVFYGSKHNRYRDSLPFNYNWLYFNAPILTKFAMTALYELQESMTISYGFYYMEISSERER